MIKTNTLRSKAFTAVFILLFAVLLATPFFEIPASYELYNPTAPWALLLAHAGVPFIFLPILLAFLLAYKKGGAAALPAIRKGAITLFLYYVFELCTVYPLKVLWGRARFFELLAAGGASGSVTGVGLAGYSPWYLPQFFAGGSSFPSGHTAFVFGGLTLFCFAVYLGKGKLPALIYSWGYVLLMAFSRVVLGRHYVSDVVAAMLIGLCCLEAAYSFTPAVAARLGGQAKNKTAAEEGKTELPVP